MPKVSNFHNIIGISGAARSGKDTLCRGILRVLKQEYNLEGIRKSIAGDQIKKDLNDLFKSKLKLDIFTEKSEEKELIRPLLVEYGKILRKRTQGRYFIENFKKQENTINIITDIRYVEYPKDEGYWLKNEINGFLVFIERKNIFDANETEKSNNEILKNMADYSLTWDTLNENLEFDKKIIDHHASQILKKYFTIYQPDIFLL